MRLARRLWILSVCITLPLAAGCSKEESAPPAEKAPPAKEARSDKEIPGGKRPAGSINVALNKPYTVNPTPNGYASTYTTDATDGKKPVSKDLCFGFQRMSTLLDVTLDIDLGAQEKISGATLYTIFNEYNEQTNECKYGANAVEVYCGKNRDFSGEPELLGKTGQKEGALGDLGKCVSAVDFPSHECRYVRFLARKRFGDGASGADWLFIKEAEVWKAAG
jgi:hypothetical protein